MSITTGFDLFFSILLLFVHRSLKIIVFLKNLFNSFQRKINITSDLDNYLKLPHHVVFVINCHDNVLSIDEIASLVNWSIQLGIENISLYDNEGLLVNYLSDIEKSISNKLDLDRQLKFRCSQQNGSLDSNIIFHCEYNSSKLRILSLLNQKFIMAMLLKEIVKKRLSEDKGKITVDEFDQTLLSKLDLPDPDLTVLCSETPCLFGLLPWNIRLTEIIHLPVFGKLAQKDFLSVISRYSNCEQRFGK